MAGRACALPSLSGLHICARAYLCTELCSSIAQAQTIVQARANSFQTRRNFHIQKHIHMRKSSSQTAIAFCKTNTTFQDTLIFITLQPQKWLQQGTHSTITSLYHDPPIATPSSAPNSTQLTSQIRYSKKSDAPTNPRGIPFAPFVDNVSDYCTTRAEVEPTLKSFSEMIQKYQFMEVNTSRRASGLREKIPDISKTLDTVRFLKSRADDAEELESFFELNDTLYAKAKVPKTEEVYLWLGANVMLAYPMEEAEELLEGKLEAAKSGLENAEEDMDFLREQITVSGMRYAD